mgnify:CR=1 FL=1
MDVAEVGGDDEAALGGGESVGFASDFFLPESFSSGGCEDGDLVVETDDELVTGNDEFERGGVDDLPEEALFEFGLSVGEGLFETLDFGEVGFDLGIELF